MMYRILAWIILLLAIAAAEMLHALAAVVCGIQRWRNKRKETQR